MHEYFYPIFTKGRVLKTKSIENLRDFPRDFLDIVYADYSDGIISGFDVTYNNHEKKLNLAGGTLKKNDRIIILKDSAFDFCAFGKSICLKLCFGDLLVEPDYEAINVEIKADTKFNVAQNEIELARFRLAESAVLRKKHEYKGVSDFTTPDNTLNLINVKYSGLYAPTFSPALLKIFAKEIAVSKDVSDISFALICLNSNIIHKGCILQYIRGRLNADFDDNISNEGIHKALTEIVRKRGSAPMNKRTGGPVII